jgi:Beta-propeller repeat
VLWTRVFGGTGSDVSNGLALDAAGNVWIGGYSSSSFAGHTNAGTDAFVARYDSAGTLLDTFFWSTAGQDGINGLAAAADGSVSVSGVTTGTLGAASAGDYDAWAASVTTVPVPEPTAALLLGIGLPALLGFRRRTLIRARCSGQRYLVRCHSARYSRGHPRVAEVHAGLHRFRAAQKVAPPGILNTSDLRGRRDCFHTMLASQRTRLFEPQPKEEFTPYQLFRRQGYERLRSL